MCVFTGLHNYGIRWPKNLCQALPCDILAGNGPVGLSEFVLMVLCYSLVVWQTHAVSSYQRCPVHRQTQSFRPGRCSTFSPKTCMGLFTVRARQAMNPWDCHRLLYWCYVTPFFGHPGNQKLSALPIVGHTFSGADCVSRDHVSQLAQKCVLDSPV